tara:strand:+ start:354 stop:1721 length:1368 start_codon:yes stop_codon:yes gene_type:complete
MYLKEKNNKRTIISVIIFGFIGTSLIPINSSLSNQFKDEYEKQIEKKKAKVDECNYMYKNAQWASTEVSTRAVRNNKEIRITPRGRIYINPKTNDIYELNKNGINDPCFIVQGEYGGLLSVSDINPTRRKLNKTFQYINPLRKIKSVLSEERHTFLIEGKQLVVYAKDNDSIDRNVWGIRQKFRDPNYNIALVESNDSSFSFGELPIRKGNYLICSNGSEISSKIFIEDPIVPLPAKPVITIKKVKNPRFGQMAQPEYLKEEIYSTVPNLPYNKNDNGQVTSFDSNTYTELFNAKSYGNSLLYGINSKLFPISSIEDSGLDTNEVNEKVDNLLSSPISQDEIPIIFKSYDIRRFGPGFRGLWQYSYARTDKITGKKSEAKVQGLELLIGNANVDYVRYRDGGNSFGRVYCLKEKNKFLLRIVDIRKSRPVYNKYGEQIKFPDFIKLTNFYFNSKK